MNLSSNLHSAYLTRYNNILDNIYDHIDILPITRNLIPAYKVRLKDHPDFTVEISSIKKKVLINSLRACNEFNMWLSYMCMETNNCKDN